MADSLDTLQTDNSLVTTKEQITIDTIFKDEKQPVEVNYKLYGVALLCFIFINLPFIDTILETNFPHLTKNKYYLVVGKAVIFCIAFYFIQKSEYIKN